jgi:alanyl-tRNA synthetase
LFRPIWDALTNLTGITYAGKYPPTNKPDPAVEAADSQLRHDIAFRVIADHVRCLTFAITDGAVPDKEGRGYVLRRILRRAAFFGRQHLGLKRPFIHTIVPVVVEAMGGAFPELRRDPARVAEIIKEEEVSFDRTIDRGLELFADASTKGHITGDEAFELHATFGFPIDLTQIIGAERGIPVDRDGYEVAFKTHQDISRGEGAQTTRVAELPPDALAKLKESTPPTDDSAKYNAAPIGAAVVGIWDGARLLDATPGAEHAGRDLALILDKTNFYAEMGGQVGDVGELRAAHALFDVTHTAVSGGYVLHVGRLTSGHLKVGDHVTATLSGERARTEKSHTATHLANWALREVLGEGVQQRGSLVDPEKLRFDFSHAKAVADDELGRVETLVQEYVAKNLPVYAQEAPQEQAQKINGLRAVFGEKYPPMVRVVSIGAAVDDLLKNPADATWRQYSVEFCGGTHLKNTGDVGAFVVTAEESVSKGIRRIVALTGDAARQSQQLAADLKAVVDKGRATPEPELPAAIAAVQKQIAGATGLPLREKRKAQAAVAELQAKLKAWEKTQKAGQGGASGDALEAANRLLAESPAIGGNGKLIVGEIPGATDDQLRRAVDSLRKRATSHAILLIASAEASKVSLISAVSDDLILKGLKAGDWVREAAKPTGGAGGGRPQMGQAGGKDPSKIADAIEAARRFATANVK